MDYNAKQFLDDVRELIAYNYSEEAADFERCDQEGGTEGHIFNTVRRLDIFLTEEETE